MSNTTKITPPPILAAPRANTAGGHSLNRRNELCRSLNNALEPQFSPRAPRERRFSLSCRLRSFKGFGSNDNLRLEELTNLIDNSDFKNVDWKDIFYSNQYTMICPDESTKERTLEECRLIKGGIESVCTTERHQTSYCAHTLADAIEGVHQRYPDYDRKDKITRNDLEPFKSELDCYFSAMSRCVQQVSEHSKSNAYLLHHIQSALLNSFRSLLISYEEDCKRPRKLATVPKIPVITQKKDDSEATEQIEKLNSEIARLKRELAAAEEEKNKACVDVYSHKSESRAAKDEIRDLMRINDSLRQNNAELEHRIFAKNNQNASFSLGQSLGSVPLDVLSIWNQVSTFADAFRGGFLESLDLSTYLPEDVTTELQQSFTLPKLPIIDENENLHFSTFYMNIKKFARKDKISNIYLLLETCLKDFLAKVTTSYKDRFLKYQANENEVRNKIYAEMENLRGNRLDPSEWIRSTLEHPNLLALPKEYLTFDLTPHIEKVYQIASSGIPETNKPRFASDIVLKAFNNKPSEELMIFLSQLSRLSKTDINCDFFKKFVLNEFPLYAFLFYSDVCVKSKDFGSHDIKSRNQMVNQLFGPYGWNTIPTARKSTYETLYISVPLVFPLFCLSLYIYCLEKIKIALDQISRKKMQDYLDMIPDLTLNDSYDLWEFILSITEQGKQPTTKEVAVVMFDRRIQFGKFLPDFNPANSEICEYISNFGKKPKKAKKAKNKESKSVKSDKMASTAPLPDLNDILSEELKQGEEIRNAEELQTSIVAEGKTEEMPKPETE